MPFPHLPVLLYHHVGPTAHPARPELTVDARRFTAHVRWLRRMGYRGLSLQDAERVLTGERPPARREVLLTFDDGYADLARYAFPTLEAAGMPATVFVVSRRLGLAADWDGSGPPLLDADVLRAWLGRGIDVGAHGRTHRPLPGLPAADLDDEVQGSRADLEELFQRPVASLAYPFGAVDANARRAVAEAYTVAFGIRPGRQSPSDDVFDVRRSMVMPADRAHDIAMRLLIGRSPSRVVRQALGGIRGRLPARYRSNRS